MTSLMTIEQILELAFKGAAAQTPPPPPPERFSVGEALETPSWLTDWQGHWHEVWQKLRDAVPTRVDVLPLALALTEGGVYGEAAGESVSSQPTAPLAVIPALTLRANTHVDARVELTFKPAVSKDGRLIFGVRVSRSGFHPDEKTISLTLLTVPNGERIESPQLLPLGEEVRIAIDLSPELRLAWQGVDWKWEELPFRVILRPGNKSVGPEEKEGLAAGFTSQNSFAFASRSGNVLFER